MLYSVAEISDSISLSKQSVYNKLKLKELEDHITKKQGVTYIDEVGFNLIKDSLKDLKDDLNPFKDDLKDLNIKEIDNTLDEEIVTDTEDSSLEIDYINSLKDSINYLKAQNEKLWNELQEKNLQIKDLNNRLAQEQDLNKNNQVLQLRQPQNIELLEQHFTDLDNKLINIKEQMEQRKNQYEQDQQQPKGFFNKLLRK